VALRAVKAALLTLSVGLASSRNTVTTQGNRNYAKEFTLGTTGTTLAQTARVNVVNTATIMRACGEN
jgi:hypothetical protein